ncbi:MAG: Asp-tRNA(Asn)/Glu-tRNA(Gln) amidotransferase subunit GatC [Bacteroidota bacterium]
MKIDKALISKLEKLARLELSAEERKQIQGDLNAILEMVAKLEELDTTDVEPLIHISEAVNVMREDVVANQVSREAALRNAPNSDDQYFKVPKVIEKH